MTALADVSEEEQREAQGLEDTKSKVLEIVWSYVYSGREAKAWEELADLWPEQDFERIKAEILQARSRGILGQVDGVSAERRPTSNTAKIFDLRNEPSPPPLPEIIGRRRVPVASTPTAPIVVPPVPILVAHVIPEGEPEPDLSGSDLLDLTIDCAGKVRSIMSADAALAALFKDDARIWKFIPALNERRAVASRILMTVSPKR
jgi:hypothetical protein